MKTTTSFASSCLRLQPTFTCESHRSQKMPSSFEEEENETRSLLPNVTGLTWTVTSLSMLISPCAM